MKENNAPNDNEIIALLESQKDKRIEYPHELFEKRRTSFLKSVALLGVTVITWSFLGLKGTIKISGLAQLWLKVLLTVAAAEVMVVSYVYQDEIRDLVFPPTLTADSVEIQPFTQVTVFPTTKASPYPTPSLATTITPEIHNTLAAKVTPIPVAGSGSTSAPTDSTTVPTLTPTDDKPGNSYGLTRTPKPGEGPNK
ncbi:MAG: hypothetical protein WHV44_14600 [Anaerolineales bacterium]